LPYPEPERLVEVATHFNTGEDETGQTGSTWEHLRDGVTSLDLAATARGFGTTGVNMVAHGQAEYVKQQRVSAGFFRVFGVAWAQADAEVAVAGDPVMRDLYQDARVTPRLHVVPLQRSITEDTRRPLFILWAAVGVVLLIGCVNIAGLFLARSVRRAPEIATRIALGGGRAAIVRQLLAESLVLAAAGGAAGIALGYLGIQAFASLLAAAFGVTKDIDFDVRVLAVTAAVSLLTSIAFGLFPALQASRVDLRTAMGMTTVAGTAHGWPRRVMVLAQVAMGVMLLVGAGLLLRTFDGLMRLRAGFDATNVMSATLSLQDARYATADRINRLFDATIDRIHTVPGVQDVAVCLTLPYERALNIGG